MIARLICESAALGILFFAAVKLLGFLAETVPVWVSLPAFILIAAYCIEKGGFE